jgi:3-hydroxyacyl-CoA dehydrogenase
MSGHGHGLLQGHANFIANRIGVFGMMYALHTMPARFSVEEMDAFGPVTGWPKSAVFRTATWWLDTLCHVATTAAPAWNRRGASS